MLVTSNRMCSKITSEESMEVVFFRINILIAKSVLMMKNERLVKSKKITVSDLHNGMILKNGN